jgi:hypothetical protein
VVSTGYMRNVYNILVWKQGENLHVKPRCEWFLKRPDMK